MTVYLLEAYLAGEPDLGELAQRLNETADAVSHVRYLRSTYVPADATCFHYVEAPTAAAAELFARRAELAFDRILEAKEELR